MTTLLKRLTATLLDWLATIAGEPLTPAHGWLLPAPRPLRLRQPAVRHTAAMARPRA